MDNQGWQFYDDHAIEEQLPPYSLTQVPLSSSDKEAENCADRNYSRSFSHPPERPYLPCDTNKAIHEEIMCNTWGSIGKRHKRRNRYAVYFPADGTFESLGQYYDNECFPNRSYKSSNDIDQPDFSGNVYATYRRAPRSYPRLDNVVNIVHNDISDEPPPISRRQNEGTHYEHFLPKLANDEVNNSARNVNASQSVHHNLVEAQPSVQHLFSIQLNDVKRINAMENKDNKEAEPKGISCDKLKSSVVNFVSRKCKRRKSGDTKRKSQSEESKVEKPFFYCRWVAEYPNTLFCKYILTCICVANRMKNTLLTSI